FSRDWSSDVCSSDLAPAPDRSTPCVKRPASRRAVLHRTRHTMHFKVINPPTSEPLTIEDARLQCKVDPDDTSHDDLLGALIVAEIGRASSRGQSALC